MNSQQPKNKNPLLSCALTGGFEDLSSGIVLATAAEKPVLFTIGNTPVINDTDNFSEVSLDRDGNSSEVGPSDLQTTETIPFYGSPSPLSELDSFNNLQTLNDVPPPTLDINSNNNEQQQSIADGNFNPISAAFGSAASTVFSTFTNIIKGSASQPRFEDLQQQQHHQHQQQQFQTPSINTDVNDASMYQEINNQYGYNLQSNENVNALPPSFFSPDDEILFKKPTVEMPSNNNTFRLGGNKKKTYAGIPGLSSSSANTQNVPQNFNLNPVMPPIPPQNIIHADSTANFQPPPPLPQQNFYENIEQKSQTSLSNKFSFSSLLDKIPVTKNLFGGVSEQQNSNDFNQMTRAGIDLLPPPPPPQIETINYFTPQTQLNEQQITNNFNPQNFIAVSADMVNVIETPHVASSLPCEINNTAAVNFFNPQQFNTSPFAKVQQPEIISASSSFSSTTMQGYENAGINNSILPPSEIKSSFMTSATPPPLSVQNEIIQPQQFSPQSFSTPSQPPQPPPTSIHANMNFPQANNNVQNINAPPPIFFNPNQASELFTKPNQNNNADGKPKNPYSNIRTRNPYRTRTSSSSDTSVIQQATVMPQAPTSNLPSLSSQQFYTPSTTAFQESIAQTTTDLSSTSSSPRPPTIEQSNSTLSSVVNTSTLQTSVVETQETSFTIMQQQHQQASSPSSSSELPTVQKKSDLNVPENENIIPFEQEQKQNTIAPEAPVIMSNVSNFFSYDNNNSKVNEQVSALNFFQVQQEASSSSQPVLNQQQQQQHEEDKFASENNNSYNAINFFNVEQDQVPKNESQQSSDKEEFNGNMTNQGNDTLNDITDKMESLSNFSRSTLSLFATSELDSTMTQKQQLLQSTPLQSLIPKYLEQQPPIGESLKAESLVNESQNQKYRPIYCHWFYQNLYWHPFSMSDSLAIDQAILNGEEVISTSGGRYDVNIKDRRRSSIYWTSGSNAIRKCSWFYMDSINQILLPYEESVADFLEKEYEKALTNGFWNHKIFMPDSNDFVIMKDSSSIEHHRMGEILTVKRGIDEFDIDDGEEATADHLILCISNFGDKIDENADEVRSKCLEAIQQYYSEAFDCGQIKRIEVLPITLNSIDVLKMGEITNKILNSSTFKSTSREINEHVMRTMLYSNENFYQKIMNHLAFSLNEIVSKFKQRNTNFGGEISLISSSYEALFLFDLLANGSASSEFWKINFEVSKFFACGMPSNLLMIRNGDKLKHGFAISGCKKLFNIIHPNDPAAQRLEPLIIPEYTSLQPELIDNLLCNERVDFILPEEEDSTIETFTTARYFSSEILVKRILNEIYGANQMDSGSL